MNQTSNKKCRNNERGAALATVLVASLLLGTACIALLTAVGASSQNNTDALSEAKAYWAAESGLQRTIDILRHNVPKVSYSEAHNSGNMAAWLGGSAPVPVGSEASYTVSVRDPDDTATSTTFRVSGLFKQSDGSYASSRIFTNGADTTTISYEGVPNTLVTHPMAAGTGISFGRFRVEHTATAAPLEIVEFKLIFTLAAPTGGSRSIRGQIDANGNILFLPTSYELLGSTITICGALGCPTSIASLLTAASPAFSETVNGRMTPIEPFRLLVRSTGYGPNSSQKMLEGVIQKNFLNGLGSDNALTFLGRSDCINFELGSSSQLDIDGGSSPSIGVVSTSTLNTVNTELDQNNTNGTITPEPDIITSAELPDWQQSPEALDALIRQLRQTARNSGRYFTNNYSGSAGWGDFDTGTGLTFCEGNCTMSGNAAGGGILVVTGTFTTSGAPSFKGLVLVTGPGGVIRGGGGQENFLGSTVIAPYDPNNLAAGFGCPVYNQNGGAGNTVALGLDPTLDGTTQISNFMIGVAEK